MAFYNGQQLTGLGANMTVVDEAKLKELSLSNEPYNNKKVNDVDNIVGYKGYKMIGYTLSSDKLSVNIELRDAELEEKARDKYKVNDKVNIEANTHLYQKQIITAIRANSVERYLGLNTVEGYAWETNAVEGISTQTLTEIMYPGENAYILCFGNPITFYIHTSADSKDKLTELGYIVGRQYEINFQNSELVSVGLVLESEDTSKCNTIVTLEEVDGSEIGFKLKAENEFDNWIYVVGKSVGEQIPQFSYAIVGGHNCIAVGYNAFAVGGDNKVYGNYGTALGRLNLATYQAMAIGCDNMALGANSFATGNYTQAKNVNAFTTGYKTIASGKSSLATGLNTEAKGEGSISGGNKTTSEGLYSVSFGSETLAQGANSFTTGYKTTASKGSSFAEGNQTTASGDGSHAQGTSTIASGANSYAGGIGTRATGHSQMAIGKYNKANSEALFIVGMGDSDTVRKNAFQVIYDGRIIVGDNLFKVNTNGTATVKSDPKKAMDVATKQYVDRLEKEIETLKQAIINLGGIVNV